jgi:hypothetical protein
MKTIFIIIIAIVALTGCSAIQWKRLANDIANYTQTVETICSTVELFSAIGKPIPEIEYCEKALKTADIIQGYDDTLAVSDTLKCVKKNDVKSVDFAECLTTVKWWPVMVDRINNEVSKQIGK